MSVKIKLRRGTASEWNSINPILKEGEPGFEIDTGKLKIGNGSGVWTDLAYLAGDGGGEIVVEDIDDRVADLLIAGTGISLSYNDNDNSLTIDADPTYDAAVEWTANHTLVDGTRYLANDLVYVSGRLYKANYDNESLPVTNTTYWTDVGPGYRLNIDGRDIPNIPNIFDQSLNTTDTATFVGINLSNGTTLAQGTFDNSTGGNSGISLNCYVGYELNWQGGHLKSTSDGGLTSATIDLDSDLRLNTYAEGSSGFTGSYIESDRIKITSDEGSSGENYTEINSYGITVYSADGPCEDIGSPSTSIGYCGITFPDGTVQKSAVSGILSGTNINIVNVSGAYTVNHNGDASVLKTTVFNNTGSQIPKLRAVYINGGQGDQPTVTLASAGSEMTSSKTYGITAENIDNMSAGIVVVFGALTGVNTDQFNPTAPTGDVNGTTVWLSPTVSGGLTITKPSAPNQAVALGTIVRTHQNDGVIEVRVQNGFELEELHNVAISGVTNGQFLNYNSASGLWMPTSSGTFSAVAATSGTFGTITNTARNVSTVNQNTVSSSQNDYNLGTGPMSRLSVSNAGLSITGFSGAANDGDTRLIFNAGPYAINISHDSSSSSAANRILIYSSGTFVLYPNNGVTVIYDNSSQRWRLF
jgi:hypothetical protein